MSNPFLVVNPNPPPQGVVAACGCSYNLRGMQLSACRLHGQVREIRELLKTMLTEYDRTGKVHLSPTTALPAIRRFVG